MGVCVKVEVARERERAVKLREVEDEPRGDYLTVKCNVGRPRWSMGLCSAVMPSVCY